MKTTTLAGLFCQACGQQIPTSRARKGAMTCSDACAKARRAFNNAVLSSGRCPHCLHPSTPEERDAYRRFRTQEVRLGGGVQGFMTANRGNKTRARESALRKALEAVTEALEVQHREILVAADNGLLESLPDEIKRALYRVGVIAGDARNSLSDHKAKYEEQYKIRVPEPENQPPAEIVDTNQAA